MAKPTKPNKKLTKSKKNKQNPITSWLRSNPLAGKIFVITLFAITAYVISMLFVRAAVTTLTAIDTQVAAGEGSGMVASRQYPGVFWWHRDGGTSTADKPRDAIYAMKFDSAGNPVAVRGTDKFPFYNVTGSPNNNWEDISMDENNNLWIGDIGANNCDRNNQKLVKVKEPNPAGTETLTILASYTFKFPDPAAGCNTWNSEAMFWLDGKMYIFAKTTDSPIYRVDLPSGTSGTATLTRIGKLTGGVSNISVSSLSDDRTRLMVAGHQQVRIFKSSNPSLKGDAFVKDIISRSPVFLSSFDCRCSNKPNVEGGSFKRNSLDVAFVSESKYLYYANPKAYGDTTAITLAGDTTVPNLSISSPSSNATVSGKIVINVTATDNVAITAVNIFYDESGIIREGTTQGTYGWGSAFDTTRLSNGAHVIKAVAYDAAGNTKAVELPVTVSNGGDISAPDVTITSPLANTAVNGTIVINVTATDNVAVNTVNILYDDGGIIREGTALGNYGWGSAFNTAKLSNGTHTIKAVATDVAGNTRTVQVQVNVQN